MYKVTGYFKEHKVVGRFVTLYDAIDFKDNVDALSNKINDGKQN